LLLGSEVLDPIGTSRAAIIRRQKRSADEANAGIQREIDSRFRQPQTSAKG
jgi:hypothetical protein